MSDPEAAQPSPKWRRLLLVVKVFVAADAPDDEIACDVGMAIELGGVEHLRSCSVSMARPRIQRPAR